MRKIQVMSVLFLLVYTVRGIQVQSDKQIRNMNLRALKQQGGILQDYDLHAINNLTYKNNVRMEQQGKNKKRQIQSKQLFVPQGIVPFPENNLQGLIIQQNQFQLPPRPILPPQQNQIIQQGLLPYAVNYPGFQQYVRTPPLPLQNIGLNPYIQPPYSYDPFIRPLGLAETVYVDHVLPSRLGGLVFPVRNAKTLFGYTRSARFLGNFLHN